MSALLVACGSSTPQHDVMEELARAEVDGHALQWHSLVGGERQAALSGDALMAALASQQVDIDDLNVATGVGPRISVLAIASPSLSAEAWKQQYVDELTDLEAAGFADKREVNLGGKQVTALTADIANCVDPCVDSVVVYSVADTVVVIQSDSPERAGELLSQLP